MVFSYKLSTVFIQISRAH